MREATEGTGCHDFLNSLVKWGGSLTFPFTAASCLSASLLVVAAVEQAGSQLNDCSGDSAPLFEQSERMGDESDQP
jgi:hypothetical protein